MACHKTYHESAIEDPTRPRNTPPRRKPGLNLLEIIQQL
ncbi:immunity-related GTPase family M protein isoform 1, partial [Daubentonia madagascariensis]